MYIYKTTYVYINIYVYVRNDDLLSTNRPTTRLFEASPLERFAPKISKDTVSKNFMKDLDLSTRLSGNLPPKIEVDSQEAPVHVTETCHV